MVVQNESTPGAGDGEAMPVERLPVGHEVVVPMELEDRQDNGRAYAEVLGQRLHRVRVRPVCREEDENASAFVGELRQRHSRRRFQREVLPDRGVYRRSVLVTEDDEKVVGLKTLPGVPTDDGELHLNHHAGELLAERKESVPEVLGKERPLLEEEVREVPDGVMRFTVANAAGW